MSFIEGKILPMDTQFHRDFFYHLCVVLPSVSSELTLDSEGRLRILGRSGTSSGTFHGSRTPVDPQIRALDLSIVEMSVLQLISCVDGRLTLNRYRTTYLALVSAQRVDAGNSGAQ